MPTTEEKVRFETELVISTTGSGWHFLIVEKKIVAKLRFADKYRRVLCSINGQKAFHCALMPWGDKFYIIVSKAKRQGLVAGDKVKVELVKDESKYGLPMPEEFEEVLRQDPEGDKLFHGLTPGKQRSILYFLSQAKDIDLRIDHALLIIEHLKTNGGRIVDKLLHEELKRPKY